MAKQHLGKKRHHGGGGANGGSGQHQRASASSSSSFVVVNPALLQSMGQQKSTGNSSAKAKPNKSKKQQNQNKRQQTHQQTATNPKPSKKKAKTQHNRQLQLQSQQHQSQQPTNSLPGPPKAVAANKAPHRLFYQLVLKKQHDLLVGVYWLLLSLRSSASQTQLPPPLQPPKAFVVVLPNQSDQLSASVVCNTLRHLGFGCLAIHSKMSATQRKQMISRFQDQEEPQEPSHQHQKQQLVLVTNEHFAPSVVNHKNSKTCALIAVQLDYIKTPQTTPTYFAALQTVCSVSFEASPTSAWQKFPLQLPVQVVPKLHQRIKVARQITQLSEESKAQASGLVDANAKWANRLAQEAGLDRLEETEESQRKPSKKLTPQEQRLKSLSERLCQLLAESLEGVERTGHTSSTSNSNSKAFGELHDKLEVLGIVTINAAAGSAVTDQRLSAQTRWMDGASAEQFGGHWEGTIRHGATKDATSLRIRANYFGSNAASQQCKCKWKPNAKPDDVDKWGGAFGKACGHNEVVMHELRPFFPQEVLNSRVCSRKNPAPGNSGFDGCLEFLRLNCQTNKRSMTVWDAEHLVFIDTSGGVHWSKKSQLLAPFALPSLRVVVNSMRLLTLESVESGQTMTPSQVFEKLQLICAIGMGTKELAVAALATNKPMKSEENTNSSGSLRVCLNAPRILRHIASFLIHGNTRQWKQIVRAPALEETISE